MIIQEDSTESNDTITLNQGIPMCPDVIVKLKDELHKKIQDGMPSTLKKCRFCESTNLKPLSNNGIKGPGYREWNYACDSCGKVQ